MNSNDPLLYNATTRQSNEQRQKSPSPQVTIKGIFYENASSGRGYRSRPSDPGSLEKIWGLDTGGSGWSERRGLGLLAQTGPQALETVIQIADRAGRIIQPVLFHDLVENGLLKIGQGCEHDVWLDRACGRVIKATFSDSNHSGVVSEGRGYADDYIGSHILANLFFYSDFRFEGVLLGRAQPLEFDNEFEGSDPFDDFGVAETDCIASPRLVISMPYVKTPVEASEKEIAALMEGAGFTDTTYGWTHPMGVVATDVKPNNVLKDSATGVVVPVDIIIRAVDRSTVSEIAEQINA